MGIEIAYDSPAPTNLVPPYSFIGGQAILIGADETESGGA